MTKPTTQNAMIKKLNKAFPNCNAVCSTEWDGRKGAIWFRGGQMPEDMPVYSQEYFFEEGGTHPELEAMLQANGWYSEPYDSATLMAYQG